MQFQFIVTGWHKLERQREALTCITNCSFYSAPTLEQVLDKPWCYVTRSSSHTHHLLLSTHPLCDSLSISLCVSLCVYVCFSVKLLTPLCVCQCTLVLLWWGVIAGIVFVRVRTEWWVALFCCFWETWVALVNDWSYFFFFFFFFWAKWLKLLVPRIPTTMKRYLTLTP